MTSSALEGMAQGAMVVLILSACYAEGVSTPIPDREVRATAAYGSSVDTSAWSDMPPHTMAELLEGRFPGVQVRSMPGGGVAVRIQGTSPSVRGTDPLYVVDGVPTIVGPNGALDDLTPADVARIEVLRGSQATAEWGSRGANGVIVITTKH